MKVNAYVTGTRPLIMHNVQLASPINKFAQAMKEISAKRIKTDEDRVELAHLEFIGSLYYDSQLGPYIPGTMVFAALREGARLTRSGKKIERGVDVVELTHPLIYEGPRTPEELWNDSNFVDTRSVRVQSARVDRTRPIFNRWNVEFDLMCDPEVVDENEIKRIIQNAGSFAGFGDYRQMYGRFTATVTVHE